MGEWLFVFIYLSMYHNISVWIEVSVLQGRGKRGSGGGGRLTVFIYLRIYLCVYK